MTSAFVQTVKVNGVTGLWRGLTATVLKVRKFLISGLLSVLKKTQHLKLLPHSLHLNPIPSY